MSISRLITASTRPPKNPAMMPSVEPITTETKVARMAISREIRLP